MKRTTGVLVCAALIVLLGVPRSFADDQQDADDAAVLVQVAYMNLMNEQTQADAYKAYVDQVSANDLYNSIANNPNVPADVVAQANNLANVVVCTNVNLGFIAYGQAVAATASGDQAAGLGNIDYAAQDYADAATNYLIAKNNYLIATNNFQISKLYYQIAAEAIESLQAIDGMYNMF